MTEEVSAWRKGEESSDLGTRRERQVKKVARRPHPSYQYKRSPDHQDHA